MCGQQSVTVQRDTSKVITSHMHSHFSYPRLAHRHVRGRMHHK